MNTNESLDAEFVKDGVYEQKGYLNQDFRYFHLCDQKKQEYSYHYHEFDKLLLFLKGKSDYLIEGKKYELKPFDFVLVNQYDIHKPVVDSSDEYDRIIIYINHDFLANFSGGDNDDNKYSLLDCFNNARALKTNVVRFPAGISASLYDKLINIEKNIASEDKEYAGDLITRLNMISFLIDFNKACKETKYSFYPEAQYNSKIIEIIEYINDNLDKNLSIDYLADNFFMSKYHMMRIFRSETGYSIHQYVTEKRILKARDLIISGVPATTAALESGFHDYSSFTRAYKNQLGSLPSETVKK